MPDTYRCILCHSTEFRAIHTRNQWSYLRCLKCGLVSLHPRPTREALMKSYDDYLPSSPEEIRRWDMMMKPIVRVSADLIESTVKHGKGRILDIGCGYGFFLGEMKSRGWSTEGVEISRTGTAYAYDKWRVPVHSRPLEDLGFPGETFDVVTLFYVIEHVLDPVGLLAEVSRILRPGGLVFLRWPHSTPIVQVLGPFSTLFDLYHTPYHLHDFSPQTIKSLLMQGGFFGVRTEIGGYTMPCGRIARLASVASGRLAEAMSLLSSGRLLLPGVSKTTWAVRSNGLIIRERNSLIESTL